MERGNAAGGGRVNGEQLAGVDERRHLVGLPVRGAAFACERTTRRAADEERRNDCEDHDSRDDECRIDDHGERWLGIRTARSDGDYASDEEQECEARREPADEAHRGDRRRARANDPPQERRRGTLCLEVEVLAGVVAQVGADGERQAECSEKERNAPRSR